MVSLSTLPSRTIHYGFAFREKLFVLLSGRTRGPTRHRAHIYARSEPRAPNFARGRRPMNDVRIGRTVFKWAKNIVVDWQTLLLLKSTPGCAVYFSPPVCSSLSYRRRFLVVFFFAIAVDQQESQPASPAARQAGKQAGRQAATIRLDRSFGPSARSRAPRLPLPGPPSLPSSIHPSLPTSLPPACRLSLRWPIRQTNR